MSKNKRICFDASIQDTVIGIGIYNDNDDIRLHQSYNINIDYRESYKAEFIGLVTALSYCYENNFKNPKLFTDNLKLAQNGIPSYLIKKYGFAELYWIPREFNKEADKLSKVSKKEHKVLTQVDISVTWDSIKNMSNKNKLKLLKILAKSPFAKAMLNEFKQGIDTKNIKKIKGSYRKDDTYFLYLYNLFIDVIPDLDNSLKQLFRNFYLHNSRSKIPNIDKLLSKI